LLCVCRKEPLSRLTPVALFGKDGKSVDKNDFDQSLYNNYEYDIESLEFVIENESSLLGAIDEKGH